MKYRTIGESIIGGYSSINSEILVLSWDLLTQETILYSADEHAEREFANIIGEFPILQTTYTVIRHGDNATTDLFTGKIIADHSCDCGKFHEFLFNFGGTIICIDCIINHEFDVCHNCHKIEKKDNLIEIDGNFMCESCRDEYSYCDNCREWHANDDMMIVYHNDRRGRKQEENYCESCAETVGAKCIDCGEYWIRSDMYGNRRDVVCPDCMESYFICDSCNDLVHCDNACSNDNGTYCESCYREEEEEEEENDGRIMSHDYKPSPIFHGESKLQYGLEIEVDDTPCDKSPESLARKLHGTTLLDYYPKHDGSLTNGVEFVTHPYSLESLTEKKSELIKFCDAIIAEGFRAHDAHTCGLHIHASKAALGIDKGLTIGNIIYLFEKYFDNMLKFSRRSKEELGQWAARYLADYENIEKENPKSLHSKARSANRYHAINLQNSDTIEFRFFRGTLNVNTIFASVQLVDNLIALSKDNDDITLITWDHIIHSNSAHAELIAYAESKGL